MEYWLLNAQTSLSTIFTLIHILYSTLIHILFKLSSHLSKHPFLQRLLPDSFSSNQSTWYPPITYTILRHSSILLHVASCPDSFSSKNSEEQDSWIWRILETRNLRFKESSFWVQGSWWGTLGVRFRLASLSWKSKRTENCFSHFYGLVRERTRKTFGGFQ